MLSRISSADLLHENGLGASLLASIYSPIAFSRARVLRWVPRLMARVESRANQRSTWLSQELWVGVKWAC